MATVFYEKATGNVRSVSSLDVNPEVPDDTGILHVSIEEFRKFFDPPPAGKLVKVQGGSLVTVEPGGQPPIPTGT